MFSSFINFVISFFPTPTKKEVITKRDQVFYHEIKEEIFNLLYNSQFPKELIKIVQEYFYNLNLYEQILNCKLLYFNTNICDLSITIKHPLFKHYCYHCTNKKNFTNEEWLSHIPAIYEKYQPLIGQYLIFTLGKSSPINLGVIHRITIDEWNSFIHVHLSAEYHADICIFKNHCNMTSPIGYYIRNDKFICKPIIILTEQNIHTTLEENYRSFVESRK